MNKKKIVRKPVPDNNVARFMGVVNTIADAFGVEDIPELSQQLEILQRACDRHIFETENPKSIQAQRGKDRRKFISIWNRRFLELMDLQYDLMITPVDIKLIGQVSKQLEEKGFSSDDYLKWVFERFLPENPKFWPPTIKTMCAGPYILKFFFENKHIMQERKQQTVHRQEAMDTINRGKVIIRTTESQELKEKVRSVLKKYSEQVYNLGELRTHIVQLEAEHKAIGGGGDNGS